MQKSLYIFILLLFLHAWNLNAQTLLNPDISFIGTFDLSSDLIKGSPAYKKISFQSPVLEIFTEGYLNPYSRAVINLSYEDDEFSAEEIYAEILRGLPFDIQIKAGKFLLGIGKINSTHPHSWQFLERPLFHRIYFGEEGFNDAGINISFILPTENFFSSIDIGVYKGESIEKTLSAENSEEDKYIVNRGTSPIILSRLSSFFQLSDFSNIEIGINGSYGVYNKGGIYDPADAANFSRTIPLYYSYGVVDFKYKYRPDSYSSLTIQGEALLNNRDVISVAGNELIELPFSYRTAGRISTFGTFLSADYQFNKQFNIGSRYDFTYGIIGDDASTNSLSNDDKNKTTGISAWFSYYPVEETIGLRLGVQHLTFDLADDQRRDTETSFKLELIFSLGPHKAHKF